MVKVCQDIFPPDGFYVDGYLKENLDIYADSITKDFDFVILISGGGMTRIGKSLIGMQVGAYLNAKVNELNKLKNTFTADNYAFRGEELISKAKEMPPYSVLVFDECGSDLMARKTMHTTTQAMLDFLRECGQLNLFLICILPDFFDLPKGVAVTRSVCLIDVDFVEKFNRGKFKFYNRRAKKMLYLKGKKFLDYEAHKPNFYGSFTNTYTIDETRYRQMKMNALQGRKQDEIDKQNNKVSSRHKRLSEHRRKLLALLKEQGMTQTAIAEQLGITQCEVSKIILGDLN